MAIKKVTTKRWGRIRNRGFEFYTNYYCRINVRAFKILMTYMLFLKNTMIMRYQE